MNLSAFALNIKMKKKIQITQPPMIAIHIQTFDVIISLHLTSDERMKKKKYLNQKKKETKTKTHSRH